MENWLVSHPLQMMREKSRTSGTTTTSGGRKRDSLKYLENIWGIAFVNYPSSIMSLKIPERGVKIRMGSIQPSQLILG
ncbi:hypothetical protein J1N35_018925 [Gossypium stocksii]|uniref:Uncharacterized protein n=1 Tax=Gossypium stocksii TaxID=47602 RepID=A0A9D3VS42_9ROSI|nr:hypothetical protein J1N35_018925 [Gossypium stocksii]